MGDVPTDGSSVSYLGITNPVSRLPEDTGIVFNVIGFSNLCVGCLSTDAQNVVLN